MSFLPTCFFGWRNGRLHGSIVTICPTGAALGAVVDTDEELKLCCL